MLDQQNAIYDARQLGMPRMLILGVQHLFAMFGATVLVPLLTGLDVSVTLLFAGLGTLLFHFNGMCQPFLALRSPSLGAMPLSRRWVYRREFLRRLPSTMPVWV